MDSANGASQAEIWDDSALVNSWNDALTEYNLYHSVHARGENVEDILKQKMEADSNEGNANAAGASVVEREHDEAEIRRRNDDQVSTASGNEDPESLEAQDKHPEQAPNGPSASSPSHKAPALPQHLIGQVHDEGLKNLLMSWYYAGYYTGLYEGQQKAA
ncbi:hypothetical protein PVAG01_01177 [Phlyctema vagabunda]|uniref:Survival Motor Neuron Gemin2-binding domain-containing protein n=1 Tax=Phlyctema vagabunda TaxID=108571 RepID=A0ABR4PWE9_9HELO